MTLIEIFIIVYFSLIPFKILFWCVVHTIIYNRLNDSKQRIDRIDKSICLHSCKLENIDKVKDRVDEFIKKMEDYLREEEGGDWVQVEKDDK